MRREFVKHLNELNNSLIEMAQAVNSTVNLAIEALMNEDAALAKEIYQGDEKINEMERKLEQLCIRIILTEQPVASDLRLVSSALKMITDLERIGDQAADIAELTGQMIEKGYSTDKLGSILEMSTAATRMTKTAILAFLNGDREMAEQAIDMDDAVDALFDKVRDEVVSDIRAEELEPHVIIDFLMIAKYLERIGDHAQNIAEWVIYSLTGKIEHFN